MALPSAQKNVPRIKVHTVVDFMLLNEEVKKIVVEREDDDSKFFTVVPFGLDDD